MRHDAQVARQCYSNMRNASHAQKILESAKVSFEGRAVLADEQAEETPVLQCEAF